MTSSTFYGTNGNIQRLVSESDAFVANEKIELSMDIPNITSRMNVYDEADVDLSISLSNSDGDVIVVPGFYYRGYSFNENGHVTGANGDKDFRVRFTLPKAGNWDFDIILKFFGNTVETISSSLYVEEGTEDRGYIGVSPVNSRTFAFDNGEAYVALGENIAYGNYIPDDDGIDIKTFSAEMLRMMRASAANGANYTRIWLMPYWLSLHKDGYAPDNFAGGMQNAAELDRIFDTLDEIDMYACVTLFNYYSFDADDEAWNYNSFSSANNAGGYLDRPQDFFTNEQAKYDTKQYFRYLIARYGYSRNIFAWELFNEVNGVEDYYSNDGVVANNVINWHNEMAEYLHTADPYGHMVTTSDSIENSNINALECIDFVSIHKYNYFNATDIENIHNYHYNITNKPVMFGETGLLTYTGVDPSVTQTPIDEELISVHLESWAGVFGGAAGGASNWHWQVLDGFNGYSVYTGISKVSKLVPWQDPTLADAAPTTNNAKIKAMGFTTSTGAYLWVYEEDCTQLEHLKGTWTEKTFSGITVNVGLTNGTYNALFYDTITGEIVGSTVCNVTNGTASVTVPSFNRDIALFITK